MSVTSQTMPLLTVGQRMAADEFHEAYSAYPDHTKFELLDGVVHMASPTKIAHSDSDHRLITLLTIYETETTGIHVGNNATFRLSESTTVQPDSFVLIAPEYRGHTQISADGYFVGSPELVIEVADTSLSQDLQAKRRIYLAEGVQEYLVHDVQAEMFHWFDLTNDHTLVIPETGIIRSLVFPGLWLNVHALLRGEMKTAMTTLQQGLASPEHAAFVAELAKRRIITS